MSVLDEPTRALVRVAAQLFSASEAGLAELMQDALASQVRPAWLDELVLSSVLFTGFPRALVAAAALRRLVPSPADTGDALDHDQWREWEQRGVATCRTVYGANYERLRHNVRALHPALDRWMLVEGYGRTISRPGLDLKRRELCAIAMLVPQGVPRQLHSHLRGALNAGATEQEVEETLDIIDDAVGVLPAMVTGARRLWDEVRSS